LATTPRTRQESVAPRMMRPVKSISDKPSRIWGNVALLGSIRADYLLPTTAATDRLLQPILTSDANEEPRAVSDLEDVVRVPAEALDDEGPHLGPSSVTTTHAGVPIAEIMPGLAAPDVPLLDRDPFALQESLSDTCVPT
jgi:hypothetical protein